MAIPLDVQIATVLLLSVMVVLHYRKTPRRSLFPPGPKGWPFIGNLLEMPTNFEWTTYHKWAQEYNTDIVHLKVMGNHIFVLDSLEVATDLLEKRSSIYSGRPRLVMLNEMMGWNFNFGFQDYGDFWRHHRKFMHQEFHPQAALRFRPHELKATHGLLRHLLDSPQKFIWHLRTMAGETVMRIAYGLKIQEDDDPYVKTAEKGVNPMFIAAIPGTFLVDHLPWLKSIPDWFPFTGWKQKAKVWRELALDMIDVPYEAARKNIANGDTTPSFVMYSLDALDPNRKDYAYQEYIIKSVAGTMYAAGSDTTVSALASCVLGLIEHPEVIEKAQQQIDEVCGPYALPTFDEYESMPYITAIVKETLRWRDILPIALPRRLTAEDEYRGYKLPAGSIVLANAWAMLHDPEVYPEPFEFMPDRFMTADGQLNPDTRDPELAAFGFGRRICPGRFMALSAVWIAVASMLAMFDISKLKDEDGKVLEPSHQYDSTLLMMPLPYPVSFKPRSEKHANLIRATVNEVYE